MPPLLTESHLVTQNLQNAQKRGMTIYTDGNWLTVCWWAGCVFAALVGRTKVLFMDATEVSETELYTAILPKMKTRLNKELT